MSLLDASPYFMAQRLGRWRWPWIVVGGLASIVGLLVGFGILAGFAALSRLHGEPWLDDLSTGVLLEGTEPVAEPFILAGELLAIGVTFWVGAVAASLAQGRSVGTLLTPARPFRWGIVGKVAAANVLLTAVVGGFQLAVVPLDTDVNFTGFSMGRFAWLIPMMLIVLIQTSGEDVFFKGWLLHRLGAATKVVWLAPMAVTVLFVALHVGNSDFESDLVVLLPLFFLSELLIMYLIIRTGGMEAAVVMHWVNNVAIFLFVAEKNTQSNDLTLVVTETPGAQSALVDEEILGAGLLASLFVLLLVAFVWRRSPFYLERHLPPVDGDEMPTGIDTALSPQPS